MKIAIYSGTVPSTTFIEQLIRGLGKHHEVLLFGVKKKPVDYRGLQISVYSNSSNMIRATFATLLRTIKLIFFYPKRSKVLFNQIQNQNDFYSKRKRWIKVVPILLYLPDVFHVQWAKDLEQWLFLKEVFGIKLVLSLRGAHINYSPISDEVLAASYRHNFPKVDAFHAVSNAIAIEAQKYNAPPDKIKTIHSPISKSLFEQFKIKNFDKKSLKILSVGRFHWKKGYRYALDAITLLKQEGVKVIYTIIASNTISEELLFQIDQLQLRDEVYVKQGIAQEQLFDEMQHYDCMLLPSVEEGIANVVLEAMALGLPVVSTNCGGMAEVVKPDETGWLVPVRDPEAIAAALLEVKNTSIKDIQHITLQAHEFVKSNFNAEDSIAAFLKLYEEVMD